MRLSMVRAKRKYKTWSDEEIDVLKALYGKIPAHEIAKILGRSQWGVYYKAYKLKLRSKLHGSNIPKVLKPIIHKINEDYINDEE